MFKNVIIAIFGSKAFILSTIPVWRNEFEHISFANSRFPLTDSVNHRLVYIIDIEKRTVLIVAASGNYQDK